MPNADRTNAEQFEIASLSLWRSEAYRAYFDALDASGGFFYERWVSYRSSFWSSLSADLSRPFSPSTTPERAPALLLRYLHAFKGDAPLHSIGAALFLNRSEIHFAKEIGYFHAPFQHVPQRDVNPTCYGDPKSPDNFGE